MTSKTGLGIKELLGEQRSQILAIAEKHGAYNVRVFGSVARGEATEDSDIDFLVDYDLEKITPWFPGGLLLDLEQLLNRKVDIATVDMLKERSRDRILHEAVPL
ncbi:MAG: DNA polymerase subunit beta [Leptolyngbyaceae cyanobacterium SL_5_14]|nr:DNA polymerase subunit beta [Leptolyngbyaceae cyanobacterium SL_5_14]